MNPMLLTLTGNDTETLGKARHKKTWIKKAGKIALWTVAPGAAAAIALHKRNKRVKTSRHAARARAAAADAKKKAEQQPTPETQAAAKTATINAAAATAIENKAAEEEQPITTEEQPAEEQPAEEQPTEEQPAEEQPAEEQPTEEQPAENQAPVTAGDAEAPAITWMKKNKVITLVAAIGIGYLIYEGTKKQPYIETAKKG